MINLNFVRKKNRAHLKQKMQENHKHSIKLGCSCFQRATVLPSRVINDRFLGGVLDQNGQYITSSQYNCVHTGGYSFEEKDFIDGTVVFIANLVFHSWGHIFTDDIRFIWWLLTDEFKKLQAGRQIKLVYIRSFYIQSDEKLRYFLQKIGLVDFELIPIEHPTQFAELYLPDPSFFRKSIPGRYYWTDEYNLTLDKIITSSIPTSSFLPKKCGKVYLSRRSFSQATKRDFGERAVEEAFVQAGFHIVYPEELSIDDQIALYQNVDTLAATSGSIAHNSAFLKKECTMIIIRKANYDNEFQYCIDEARGIKTIYVDACCSFLNNNKTPVIGPFFIYASSHLIRLIGGKTSFSIREFLLYIFHSLFHRDLLDRIFFRS